MNGRERRGGKSANGENDETDNDERPDDRRDDLGVCTSSDRPKAHRSFHFWPGLGNWSELQVLFHVTHTSFAIATRMLARCIVYDGQPIFQLWQLLYRKMVYLRHLHDLDPSRSM